MVVANIPELELNQKPPIKWTTEDVHQKSTPSWTILELITKWQLVGKSGDWRLLTKIAIQIYSCTQCPQKRYQWNSNATNQYI
jgi:hypothetical protein